METPEGAAAISSPTEARGSLGIWPAALVLTIVFGYLGGARRAAIGQFIEQVRDIIADFRGDNP